MADNALFSVGSRNAYANILMEFGVTVEGMAAGAGAAARPHDASGPDAKASP